MKPSISLAALGVLLCLCALQASAQEKMKYHFSGKAESIKYVQQHAVDVGDAPTHQLRIAELQTKYASDAPVFAGVKVVESRGTLMSDYTEQSGRFQSYAVVHMANGDRMYQRGEGLAHTSVAADGARKTSYSSVTTITGGTGKFVAIRGTLRTTGFTDFKTGTSGNVTDGEYWFEK